MKLETERLILRDIEAGDEASIIEGLNNLNVTQFMLGVPFPYGEEHAKGLVKSSLAAQSVDPREDYNFRILIKPGTDISGGVRLSRVNREKGMATLGYWMAESHWGKGYASEAARKMLDFGFNDIGLKNIQAHVTADNVGSNKMLEKLGFELESVLKRHRKLASTGKVHDEHVYRLLKDRYVE